MTGNSKIPGNRFKKSNSRPTIGFLTYGFDGDPNSSTLWSGIYNLARKKEVNLICFPGNPPNSPFEFDAQANAIYNLISTENFDGLLIWGSGLLVHSNYESVKALYAKYHSIPIVSIGLALEGITNISIDNYQGIYEIAVHLIKDHGYRRIAFFQGPENHFEAEERYRAYRDALDDYGLPFVPALVIPGDFKQTTAYNAMNRLLEQPKIQFEAVLAANDRMALGAMECLMERGIKIPDQIVVAGFDDIEESKYVNPSLTTSRQPFYEMGSQAMEMMLALLEGKRITGQTLFPTRLMIRHSCGCPTPKSFQISTSPKKTYPKNNSPSCEEQCKLITSELMQATNSSIVILKPEWAEQLVHSFCHDVHQKSGHQFLETLQQIFQGASFSDDDEMIGWHGIISTLYRLALPYLQDNSLLNQAEGIWQQAHLFIEDTIKQTQAYQRLHIKNQVELLYQINRKLGTSFAIPEFIDKVIQELPQLGIPRCYLSLYEDPSAEWSKIILAYNREGRIELDPGNGHFPSHQLIPDHLWPQNECYAMVVEPLYFKEKQLGFALFESGPLEGLIYEVLREELSGLLYGIFLLQERKQAEKDLIISLDQVKKAMEGAIEAMALAVEMRDPYTAGHQRRVAQLACAIAQELGLSKDQIDGIKLASMIHDIGKLAVPAEILSKPTQLTKIEFEMIKTHPQVGYDILKAIEFPWPIAQIVLQHHKRFDGSGYPNDIPEESLLLESKIVSVADVVEAMSSHRPYRPSLGLTKALQEISMNRGRLYDPQVVDACIHLLENGWPGFN
jgi:DNA-binding LacI/PurR family transcriptional regulator